MDPDDDSHSVFYLAHPDWCSVQNDSIVGTAPDTAGVENITVSAWDYCKADTASFFVSAVTVGDVNGDEVIDVADAVYLLNYLFKGGGAPDPLATGDCNCDDTIDLGDAVLVLNYLFKGGQAPGDC